MHGLTNLKMMMMSDAFYLVIFWLIKHQTKLLKFTYTSITIIQARERVSDSHFDISTVI